MVTRSRIAPDADLFGGSIMAVSLGLALAALVVAAPVVWWLV